MADDPKASVTSVVVVKVEFLKENTMGVTLKRGCGYMVRALIRMESRPDFDGTAHIRLNWIPDPNALPTADDIRAMEEAVVIAMNKINPETDFEPLPTIQ